MAIEIDVKKTALLSMDFQNDIIHPDAGLAQAAGFAKMVQETGILPRSAKVLDAARKAGMKVIHIVVEFGPDAAARPSAVRSSACSAPVARPWCRAPGGQRFTTTWRPNRATKSSRNP